MVHDTNFSLTLLSPGAYILAKTSLPCWANFDPTNVLASIFIFKLLLAIRGSRRAYFDGFQIVAVLSSSNFPFGFAVLFLT